MSKNTYLKAVKELIDKKYLIAENEGSNVYQFKEYPSDGHEETINQQDVTEVEQPDVGRDIADEQIKGKKDIKFSMTPEKPCGDYEMTKEDWENVNSIKQGVLDDGCLWWSDWLSNNVANGTFKEEQALCIWYQILNKLKKKDMR